MTNRLTGKSRRLLDSSSPALLAKIFLFSNCPNQIYNPRRLVPIEGRLAIVTNAGRDAVDADGAFDEQLQSGRRSRVVLMPRRWHQVGGGISADDSGKKARSLGRARRKPLKPLRGECRVKPV